jgi:hypothetical protein
VISCRGRDYPLSTFSSAEQEQFVQGTALFESAGSLQVVKLQINFVAGGLGKRRRKRARRKIDRAANAAQGRLDVIETKHFLAAPADAGMAISYLNKRRERA